jgi:GNAT superfamily N-acetyltransferase
MFLTNEKKKHNTWQGTFYTRKWNDQTPVVYFEKLYGGRPLLKKINQLALEENLIFNSSMVYETNSAVWQSAGWKVLEKLNVLSLSLKNIKQSKRNVENVEVFTDTKIPEVIKLDHNIFEPYWQNSSAAFKETIESCVHNYLFVQKNNNDIVGYGILGITRNYGFLQRFGIVKEYQNSGLGGELLDDILTFSKQKKLVNVRLNTQTQNKHAQSLYLNNGFVYTKTNFLILATSNHK